MRIEPIDLRPQAMFGSYGQWLWVANALLFALLIGLWFWQNHHAPSGADDLLSERTRALSFHHAGTASVASATSVANTASVPEQPLPFDWDQVLQALERVYVNGIKVDALKIDSAKRETSLTVSFQTYEQVGLYLGQLAAYPTLGRCVPLTAEGQQIDNTLGQGGRALLVCTSASIINSN